MQLISSSACSVAGFICQRACCKKSVNNDTYGHNEEQDRAHTENSHANDGIEENTHQPATKTEHTHPLIRQQCSGHASDDNRGYHGQGVDREISSKDKANDGDRQDL